MKKIIFSLIFVLMCSFGFMSCSHDFETYTQKEIVQMQYDKAFENTFGNPDQLQTWGFNNVAAARVITRSVIKENHELPQGYVKPTLESGEAEYVMNYFKTNEGENSVGYDWLNKFFIVYVGGNSNVQVYSSWNNNTQNGNVTLDYLQINGEHINDWNANYGPTVYVYNSKANNFTAHNSYCNITTSKWKLAQITYNGKVGYYVGISAYGRKDETTEKYQLTDYGRENFYDDWVFKLVPANGVTPPQDNVRIIVEDLSATNSTDFDFNDVVLDVNIVNGNAECILQAAGGTLPLRIQEYFEVHELFGLTKKSNGLYDMVNTNNGTLVKDPVSFTITDITNAAQIKFEVFKNNEWIEITANQGRAAAKIAVNQDFSWCNERQSILEKYPNFNQWVKDVNYIWW